MMLFEQPINKYAMSRDHTHTHTHTSRNCQVNVNPLTQPSTISIISLYCLALEDGTGLMSPEICNQLPTYTQKRASTTARPKAKNSTAAETQFASWHNVQRLSAGPFQAVSNIRPTTPPSIVPHLLFRSTCLLVSNFHCLIFFHPSDSATSHFSSC